MPAIKSSSKTGTSLVLFATEKKQLASARRTCEWISEYGTSLPLTQKLGAETAAAIEAILAAVAAVNGEATE